MVKFNRESAGKMTRKENTTGETVSYTLCIKLHTVSTITHCVLKIKNYTLCDYTQYVGLIVTKKIKNDSICDSQYFTFKIC